MKRTEVREIALAAVATIIAVLVTLAFIHDDHTAEPAPQTTATGWTSPLGSRPYAPRSVSTPPALTPTVLLEGLTVAPEGHDDYDGRDWQWGDADGNGCPDGQDAEARQAVRVEIMTHCAAVTGEWYSVYDGATWFRATDVEVDHIVARHDAYLSGGATWDADKRTRFIGDPTNLIPVTARVNSAKGDRGPDRWPFPDGTVAEGTPAGPGAVCVYAARYVAVKSLWNLTVTPAQKSALAKMLEGCPDGQ